MKKLLLTILAAGALLLAPVTGQAQTPVTTNSQPGSESELVQLSVQLNKLAVNLGQLTTVLDVHANQNVDAKDATLTKEIEALKKNLEKAAGNLEKIQNDRQIHSAPDSDEDDDLLDTV